MGNVEDDEAETRLRPWKRNDIVRRGHKMRVVPARVDRLLVLNAALENVLADAAPRSGDRSVG